MWSCVYMKMPVGVAVLLMCVHACMRNYTSTHVLVGLVNGYRVGVLHGTLPHSISPVHMHSCRV